MTVFKLNDLSKTGFVTANLNFQNPLLLYLYIYTHKEKIKHRLIY
jgi:hypothetical protein